MENSPVKNYIKYNHILMIKHSFLIFKLFLVVFLVEMAPAMAQKQPLRTIVVDPGHGGLAGGAQGSVTREAILALKIGLKLRDMLKSELPDTKILITRERDELPGGLGNKDAALKWRAEYANQNNGDLFIAIHLNASPQNQRYERRVVGSHEETYYVYQGRGRKKKKIEKTRTVNEYERFKLPPVSAGTQTYILARDWYQRKVNAAKDKVVTQKNDPSDSAEMLDMFKTDPVQARILAQQYAKYFFQKSLTLATFCEEEFAQIGRRSWGVLQRDWDGIWVLQATQMPSILVETGFVDNATEEAYLNSDKGQAEIAHSIVNAVKRYKEVLENPAKATSPADSTTTANNKSANGGLPNALKVRENVLVETIATPAKEISVSFYDNAEVDGDTISVYDNNVPVISHQGLNTLPITIKIALTGQEPEHDLVMVAENLGLVPPNTAVIMVNAGGKQYKVNLSSSLQKNAVVKFKLTGSGQ